MLDDFPIRDPEEVDLTKGLMVPSRAVQGRHKIAFGHAKETRLISERTVVRCEVLEKRRQPVADVGIVLDVVFSVDEFGHPCKIAPDQAAIDEIKNQSLVGGGFIKISDLGRTVELTAVGWIIGFDRGDHVPMLDDSAFTVRVEKIRGQPFGLPIIDVLIDLYKDVGFILQGAHDLKIANRIVLKKGLKEGDKPLRPIGDAGRVLGVTITGIGGNGFAWIAVLYAFHVKVYRVLLRCGHDATPHPFVCSSVPFVA